MPISKYPRWPALGPILFPGQAAPGTFRNSGRSALHTFKYPGLSFFVTNVTLALPPSSFVTKNHQPFLVKNKSLKKKTEKETELFNFNKKKKSKSTTETLLTLLLSSMLVSAVAEHGLVCLFTLVVKFLNLLRSLWVNLLIFLWSLP